MSNFVHLHLHSDFSLLDGLGKIDAYMKRANEFGMGAVALTDHGALYGAINFYEAAHKAGVKPIVGCCLPGQLIYTEEGVKPIEEVCVGERVLTHKGRFRPVLRTMTRRYEGTLYGVRVSHSQVVWLTDEHPLLVLDRHEEGPHWVRADAVTGGRATRRGGLEAWQSYATFPRLNTEEVVSEINVCDYLDRSIYCSQDDQIHKVGIFNKYDRKIRYTFPATLPVTAEFATFLGLFLAEGSFHYDSHKRPTAVVFSFGSQHDSAAIEHVCSYLRSLDLSYTQLDRSERGSIELLCNSTVLARFLHNFCGAGVSGKRIPAVVNHFASENIRAFLDGLAAGDGKIEPNGRVTLRMANRNIVYGARLLAASLGWFGSVKETPASGASEGIAARKAIYTLSWSPNPAYRRHRANDSYLFPPIREVAQRDYRGPVFNLEVEEDNSYVTDIALHNCEMYVAPRGMRSREGRVDQEQIYHLVLLAKNAVGYQNLIKLVSRAHIEGFYYKPRVDHDLLREYSEGIVCLSACLAAEVPRALLAENYDEAKRVASLYRDIYGEGNYFLELQDHPSIPEQKIVNEGVIQLSRDLSLPLVCTSDVHYLNRDDMAIQDVLICVQTGKTLDDPKRLKMTSDTNFFRSPEEMTKLFAHVPEAVSNTALIADMCELEIKTGTWVLPHYPVPQEQTTEEHLREKVLEGLRKRCFDGLLGIGIDGSLPPFHSPGSTDLPQHYLDRVDYELDIINKKGYPAYFLIVQDFANWARSQGIVITTRGSAAGSLVSYGLGIVSVDPLVYQLPFERFLNPFRPSPPDIDMDFEDSRREEVIEYVSRKYGEDKVAQIITFGAMEAKAAIRDVGRVMGMAYGDVDRIAKLIPATVPPTPIERALELVPDLRKLRESDSQVAKLIDTARRLEGVTRNAGTHAAGVIITEHPLTTYAPIQKDIGGGNKNLIQFDMRNAETIGLMKMDFLGLANLSVLGRAIKILKEYRDFDIDLDRIPLTDKPTYELLSTGETTGLFQVESGGMRRYLKDLKPSTILDIAAMIALYRPGPMPFIPVYIERKHDPSKVEFLHPSLEPILKDSFGVLVYQDDILFIAIQIAGYDWEKADKLRKAVGKKDLEVLQAEEEKFVKGCQSHGGLAKQDAQKIWEWMLPFARYGFNKAHAAAYAQITYQTAYLKANYPAEYMAAFLSTAMGDSDKVVKGVIEVKRMQASGTPITILPPALNTSRRDFSIETVVGEDGVERQGIRFGLAAVKNVGVAAIDAIIAERAKQPEGRFASLDVLCAAVDSKVLNKRLLESLVKAGALDEFGARAELFDLIDSAMTAGQSAQRAREAGQTSLFGLFDAPVVAAVKPKARGPVAELPRKTILAWEKEVTGLYFSEHPLSLITVSGNVTALGEITDEMEGRKITIVAMVSSLRRVITKRTQAMMGIAMLEDMTGTVEMVAFPECYERCGAVLTEDAIITAVAKVEVRNDTVQLVCESAEMFVQVEESPEEELLPILHLTLSPSGDYWRDVEQLNDLNETLRVFDGDEPVVLHVMDGDNQRSFRVKGRGITFGPELAAALTDRLGPAAFRQEMPAGLPDLPEEDDDELLSAD